jgi:hypothetical protein
LATCQEEKKKSIIIIIKEKKNLKNTWYQTLFYLLKFWPQFDRRICRICSSWISDDKAINYSVKIRLRKRQPNELSESQTLHQDPMTVTEKKRKQPEQEANLKKPSLEGIEI